MPPIRRRGHSIDRARTLLRTAVRRGDVERARMLLDEIATVEENNFGTIRAELLQAFHHSTIAMADMLYGRLSSADAQSLDLVQAFYEECLHGRLANAQWIFTKDFHNRPMGHMGYSGRINKIFAAACEWGHMDVALWIYRDLRDITGLDIHHENDYAFTQAAFRAEARNAGILQWLYSLGGVNLESRYERAFTNIVKDGDVTMARWLYGLPGHHGFPRNLGISCSAFIRAVSKGDLPMARWLYSLPTVWANVGEYLMSQPAVQLPGGVQGNVFTELFRSLPVQIEDDDVAEDMARWLIEIARARGVTEPNAYVIGAVYPNLLQHSHPTYVPTAIAQQIKQENPVLFKPITTASECINKRTPMGFSSVENIKLPVRVQGGNGVYCGDYDEYNRWVLARIRNQLWPQHINAEGGPMVRSDLQQLRDVSSVVGRYAGVYQSPHYVQWLNTAVKSPWSIPTGDMHLPDRLRYGH